MKRVAVVTGGSKGIGLGIVKEFISKEINVLVIARNEELLTNLKSNYNTEQIEILIGDVSDTDLPNKALKLASCCSLILRCFLNLFQANLCVSALYLIVS